MLARTENPLRKIQPSAGEAALLAALLACQDETPEYADASAKVLAALVMQPAPWLPVIAELEATERTRAARVAVLEAACAARGLDAHAALVAAAGAGEARSALLAAAEAAVPQPRLEVHDYDEILDGEDEPIPWLVEGVLARGSVTIIYGEPGCGKTWVGIDLAHHVADGLPWLGHATEQGSVLLIDEESGPRRLRNRMRRVARSHGLKRRPIQWTSMQAIDLNNDEDVAALDDVLGQCQPALAFIDAWAEVVGTSDENKKNEMTPLMRCAQRLALKHNCAIFIIHHPNRNGGYRGSSAIPAGADVIIELTCEEETGALRFRSTKNRDGKSFTFHGRAAFDDVAATYDVEWEGEDVARTQSGPRLSPTEQAIINYLGIHGPATINAICQAKGGLNRATVRSAANNLAHRGFLRKHGNEGRETVYAIGDGEVAGYAVR